MAVVERIEDNWWIEDTKQRSEESGHTKLLFLPFSFNVKLLVVNTRVNTRGGRMELNKCEKEAGAVAENSQFRQTDAERT